jgi:hypothetical protein
MSARTERSHVAGVFEDETSASAAVKRLAEEHFLACNDLSVIVSHRRERQAVPIMEIVPVERTAAIGAAVGALLVGAGVAIAGLTFGPFTLTPWGPVWASFEGAFAGGATGFAMGAMMAMGLAKPRANFSAAGFHDGIVWVEVRATGARAEKAHEILAEAGAKHFLDGEPGPAGSHRFRAAAA